MNAAVITKIEYRLIENPDFTTLAIVPYSGKLKQDEQETEAGIIYTTVVDLSVSKIETNNNIVIQSIDNRKAQFRITDANETQYLVGNVTYPARLVHQKALDGTPGSFGGYKCTITQKSPNDDIIQ